MDDGIFVPRLAMALKKIFYQGRDRKDEVLREEHLALLLDVLARGEADIAACTDPLERLLLKVLPSPFTVATSILIFR